MHVIPEARLSIQPIGTQDDATPPHSRICADGQPTDTIVAGAVREACVGCDRYYLLFMTDDIPYEDALHIHLLDPDMRLVESAQIGAPYATGSFRSLQLDALGAVSFEFMGGTTWTVRVWDRPRRHIPFLSDPRGVSRRLRFSSRLQIDGAPVPAPAR
ncbi:MAG: hypothetical protein R3E34_06810 [Rhodocyclaceae bacterium]